MADPKRSRLAALERRVQRLTSVMIVQSVLLAVVVLFSALRAAPLLTLCAMIAIPVLVFYRDSLPGWARALGRFAGRLRAPAAAGSKGVRNSRSPVNP